MKKTFVYILVTATLLGACGKGESPTPAPTPIPTPVQPTEPPVVFKVDAGNGSISLNSTFKINVSLTSAMPTSQGITVSATVTDQTNNANLAQAAPVKSTSSDVSLTLSGLPEQHWCNVLVSVSSVATPANSSTQSFTVVYK